MEVVKQRKTFITSDEYYKVYNGQGFEVISEITPDPEENCLTEPMFRIRLADGSEFNALPEEIYEEWW